MNENVDPWILLLGLGFVAVIVFILALGLLGLIISVISSAWHDGK